MSIDKIKEGRKGVSLNNVNDETPAVVYFGPTTIGRPCEYGIVQNIYMGSYNRPDISYWSFQIANCTNNDRLYVRKRINSNSPNDWSAWQEQ